MRRASGRVPIGCLFSLLLLTAALYFGVNIGEVYWRHYRFQHAMQQEVRFARMRTDQAIGVRLAAVAESLGVPIEGRRVTVNRDDRARHIDITAAYAEQVELPGLVRSIRFTPRAAGGY